MLGGRSRGLTVVRTELGRAYSVAGQARMAQAMEELPGLRKQWRRSGKIHSRLTHPALPTISPTAKSSPSTSRSA